MDDIKIYAVGGSVRDEFLNIPCHDNDFCVIASSYEAMKDHLLARNAKIYLERPEFGAIRCKLEPYGDADFTLGRKDGFYSDGRHPDSISLANTIEEDLCRRDFTIGAIAKDEDGNIIDPFNGVQDIKDKIIRCVGNPRKRFKEDSLRLIRAIRFSITKGMQIHEDTQPYLFSMADSLQNVSVERIREELYKCFKHDTVLTIDVLSYYGPIKRHVFKRGLWLKPTLEK